MLRSSRSRLLGLLLFALAGAPAPVWEIGHALRHAHERHHGTPATGGSEASGVSVVAGSHGHDHPVFQRAARPSGDLTPNGVALPAASAPVLLTIPAIRALPRFTAEARAGPTRAHVAQPRAPPLL